MTIVEELVNLTKINLTTFHEAVQELTGKKIVISIIDGKKVIGKLIRIAPKKERKETTIKPEDRQAIKLVKKSVKVNTDVGYLLVLIDDVKDSINRIDFKYITEDAAKEIREKMQSLDKILGKATLKLEYLPSREVKR